MPQKITDRTLAFIAAILFASVVMVASAAAQTADPQQLLARADANGDGDISWSEVTALRAESFDRLDRNKDGVVSADDSPGRGPFAARFSEAFERVQADYDTDRDGQVTEDEMLNAPAPLFERGDVDEDGVLTGEEMAALRASAQPQ